MGAPGARAPISTASATAATRWKKPMMNSAEATRPTAAYGSGAFASITASISPVMTVMIPIETSSSTMVKPPVRRMARDP